MPREPKGSAPLELKAQEPERPVERVEQAHGDRRPHAHGVT